MPCYEYHCAKCKKKFEVFLADHHESFHCPKCGHLSEQVFSLPARRDPDKGIQR